ncbi:hypothetical protein A2690_04735 [Candidatus Roizmanbacteria bacterium RIFCSPHIGHO2_01_FULL_39_12b]|uniref:Enolase n=1 Tax=Candidatus Roizmanbacteria bacterium RIFCSPHIGHO2_01_FULL_39_12b TaxID=1802030 RepID=A0A1F7GA44_9BACT|nr:MAG: hypothetical protein A2690_04735 [Candidatus Roizmanbacteria bacterium RIFCSPHIGHO2_01_FULL_39_12b]OGK46756.1 MAG: hypothetical protein A3B46_02360 [Candidatus Roizmanbacteria bacterium RIFCSPLOWO2_01_FULL_39_19]
MAKVKKITAREIFDSRGVPTVGASLETDSGIIVETEVASGQSIGTYEPRDIRDNDSKRFAGMGVQTAVSYINNLISPKLVGVDVARLHDVDYWLIGADGTDNKSKLGNNTITAISQLFLKAVSTANNLPIYKYVNVYFNDIYKEKVIIEKVPSPIINLINGGRHGSPSLDFQEFHIIPQTANSYQKTVEVAVSIYNAVRKVLDYRNVGTFLSEQGGFSPKLRTNVDALEVIREATIKEKVKLGVDMFLGIDCASSFYFKENKYVIKDREDPMDETSYVQFIAELIKNYSLLIVEDPLFEDASQGWKRLTSLVGQSCHIVGDDLVAGDKRRFDKAIGENLCNSVVIKFGQFSTVSEILEVIARLKKTQMKIIVSQRFGETIDSLIADVAVGIQADFVKFGSINRGERVVKYNRLLKIQDDIETKDNLT